MKTILLAAVSGAVLSITATGAMAGPLTDITQFLSASQKALDTINIAGDAEGTTAQTAINAGNLVNLQDANDQNLGDIWQTDYAPQFANNWADSIFGSFDGLTQEATNVANSISNVNQAFAIYQKATGPQIAGNEIGYGATNFVFDDSGVLNATQKATNVSNIASLTSLTAFSTQTSDSWQSASNATSYFGPPPFFLTVPAPISNLDQEATNATNLLSVNNLPTAFSFLPEISQTATGSQLATNIVNVPSVTGNLTQAATNVANSVAGIQ